MATNLAIAGVIAAAVVVVGYYILGFKLNLALTAANEALNPGYDDSVVPSEYAQPLEYSSEENSPPAYEGYARALNEELYGLGARVMNR